MNPNPDRDRNLLFGVFAVQLRKVTPSQIMEAAAAWATDPSKGLADRLRDARALSSADCDLLQRLVAEAVEAHGGDAAKTLNAFGGADMVADSFHRSIVLTPDGLVSRAEMGLNLLGLEDPILLKGVDEAPGRYTCESEHARGGHGRVLLVHDEFLGREIALKELLPDPHGDSSRRTPTPVRQAVPLMARFLQEARITGQLEHPSIVPVYELGHRTDGSLYYTMKLVRGRTLATAFAEARTLDDRLSLLPHFVDMCQAIAYAHSRRVIHRDIKPSNVMVGEFGETVVLDWGLAKVVGKKDIHADALATTFHALQVGDSDSAAKTQYGQALGTPMYMPPEQAKGQIEQVDERSDIYSLGAVLYELLTGQPPFKGKDIREILQHVIEDEPRPVTSLAPKAPPELAAIAMRALNKDPKHRYQTAKELAEEVQRFQAGALVQTYTYSAREYLTHFVRQHKPAFATAAAALAVIVALVAFGYWQIAGQRNHARAAEANAIAARNAETEALNKSNAMVAELERNSYVTGIRLALSRMEHGERDLARTALLEAPEGLRNWEWGYLFKSLDRSLLTLTGNGVDGVNSAAFSPDGSRIVTASTDKTAKVWNAESGKELLTLTGHGDTLLSASFGPDGRRIVTASGDKTAKVWDADTGKELLTITGHGGTVYDARFSPDGRRIVTASGDKTAKVWDADTGKELLTITGHGGTVFSAAFSPDGSRIVTASTDKTAKVWNAESGKELLTLTGHGNAVHGASFSPDGARIVTASEDMTAKVWDADTGKEILTLDRHGDVVSSASFSPDGWRIVTASGDKTAKVWDADTGKELLNLTGHGSRLTGASFSPDGRRVVSASHDGTAKVWDAEPPKRPATLAGHKDEVRSALFSPDGARIVTASEDMTAKVWDADTGKELLTITGHGGTVYDARFSPDGRRIVTASGDKTAKVWDADTGKELLTITGHGGTVISAAFSPDGRHILTASLDGSAKLWDVESGEELVSFRGQRGQVQSASFSSNGRQIVTASSDGTAKIWNAESGQELFTLSSQDEQFHGVNSAQFSPDGRRIVTASSDHSAKVWDAESGKKIVTLLGHGGVVTDASFTPDGQRILTISRDGSTKLWDVESGKELMTIPAEAWSLYSAAFSPDGYYRVVTASGDMTAKIWDVGTWRSDAWRDDAERRTLIRLARRENPIPKSTDIDPVSPAYESRLAELEGTFSQWKDLANSADTSRVRDVNGEGILLEDSSAVPSAQGLAFRDGDLIMEVRVDSTAFYNMRDAAAGALSAIKNHRADSGKTLTLWFDVANIYDRRIYRLVFKGFVKRTIQMTRQRAIALTTMAATVIQSNMSAAEKSGDTDRDQTLFFGQVAAPFNLIATDELRTLYGTKITGYPSLFKAFQPLSEGIRSGQVTSWDLNAFRPSTDQWILTTVAITE